MKTKIKSIVIAASFFASAYVSAQMSLTGDLRTRSEYRHGYQAPFDSVSKSGIFTGQRTRLNFGYKGENYNFFAALQDVRTWGQQKQLGASYPDAPAAVYEAYGQYFFNPKLSLKVGRQALKYDDERLFGPTDWALQGRAHDAGMIAFEDTASKLTINIVGAYNNADNINKATNYTISPSYKTMELIWANKKFGPVNASILFANIGVQSPINPLASRCFQTAGTNLEFNKDGIFASLRFYQQMGNDANMKEINANMIGVDFRYTVAKKTSFGLGMERMTGQSQTDTTKAYNDVNHIFNPLFGTAHKFNGYMDYFYTGSAHGNVGLMDIYAKIMHKEEKWGVALDFHTFAATAAIFDPVKSATNMKIEEMDSNLGMEIDLTLNYNFNKNVAMIFGYSHYLPTESIAYLKGVKNGKGVGDTRETANWAYLQFNFKPNFLK